MPISPARSQFAPHRPRRKFPRPWAHPISVARNLKSAPSCDISLPLGLLRPYASILGRAQRQEVTVEAEAPMPLELQHWSMHSHSALFCEVRVNTVTGELRVSRFLGSFDCGRILNAKTAASQFRGGIIMGLGLALMEEVMFDERTGRIMNPSLAEYYVPVHLDVPEIDVI
jgi:xanthine dehydrogenase YagR molybdenum-binding subunit